MLMYVLMRSEQGFNIAQIARETGNTWSCIQRWIRKAGLIRNWLKKEYWPTVAWRCQVSDWPAFTRDFSWAFYPARSL
jgi:hypothetical protein